MLIIAGALALLGLHARRFVARTLLGVLLLAAGALAGTIAAGMQGYRAFTREEVAARLSVRPTGSQHFAATVRHPDGRENTFLIAGDEVYVDAHILKWKPIANVLGLHTAYELDRIGGRYRDIDKERRATRTIYPLRPERTVDLFDLRRRYDALGPLLDADYGSATFVAVTRQADLEVRVSTTGLLIREAKVTAP
ncbi:MAG: hypothetical protein ABUS79_00650 [Pseudomonadota bacterium]